MNFLQRGHRVPDGRKRSLPSLFGLPLLLAACLTVEDPARHDAQGGSDSPLGVETIEEGQVPDSIQAAQRKPGHLIILHTNDIHGQVLPLPATWVRDQNPPPDVGGLERVARYVLQVREEARESGADVLVIDAGDWFQGTPEGGLEQGLPLIQIMAHMGYDALCVGNHEFDHGVQALLDHLQAVPLPALLANVAEPNGRLLAGTIPYKIFQRAGSRILLVGLLSTETPSITHPTASQLTWNDEAATLRQLQVDLEGQYDWVVPVTHMGIERDRVFANEFTDLPLLIGGHSHTLLKNGLQLDETLIVQAGSKARGVGRVDVLVDPSTGLPLSLKAQVVNLFADTVGEFEVPKVAELCATLVDQTEARMSVVVGEITADMPRSRELWTTSPLGNWITDVMRERSRSDLAMQNRGGIRANWVKGPINRRDIFSILPFDNSLVVLTMPGSEIEAFMRRLVEGDSPRGIEISGARLTVQKHGESWRLMEMEIGGQPLDPHRSYRFVTNNYLAGGGDGFDELPLVAQRETNGLLQRDLMETELASKGTISPQWDNRYLVLDPEH